METLKNEIKSVFMENLEFEWHDKPAKKVFSRKIRFNSIQKLRTKLPTFQSAGWPQAHLFALVTLTKEIKSVDREKNEFENPVTWILLALLENVRTIKYLTQVSKKMIF